MPSSRILIVQDEAPIREMIVFHLSRAGYDTIEAADCRAARELLADEQPDLALIDWMLPDMSGLELTRMLKRDDLLALPVRNRILPSAGVVTKVQYCCNASETEQR